MSSLLLPVSQSEVGDGVELETLNYNVKDSEPQILVKRGENGVHFYMDKKKFYREINGKVL
jgi:hypothetical protein